MRPWFPFPLDRIDRAARILTTGRGAVNAGVRPRDRPHPIPGVHGLLPLGYHLSYRAPTRCRGEFMRGFLSSWGGRLALLLVLASFSPSQVVSVRQDGTGDHTTITAALAAAQPGDIIEIQDNGTYVEDLVISGNFLTLRAAQHRKPILQPATTTPGAVHVRVLSGTPNPVLAGLTFDGAGSQGEGVVLESGVTLGRVQDCRFLDYQGAGQHALLLQSGILDTLVERCEFVGCRRSVTVVQCASTFVRNCLIWNQPSRLAAVDWGLKGVDQPSWLGVINCTIDVDGTGPGIIFNVNSLSTPMPPPPQPDIPGIPPPCSGFGDVYMSNCIIVNGAPTLTVTGPLCGISFSCFDAGEPLQPLLPADNHFGNPLFVDRANGDFGLLPISMCRNSGTDGFLFDFADDIEGTCRPISGGVDRGCYEETGAVFSLDYEWNDPVLDLFLEGPATFAGDLAIGGASLTSCPGLLVPTGRIPLAIDGLLAAVADPANAAIFGGLNGVV
ncbi:MAG TPA: hypothetical protein ENK43_07710, partial [Planctomycetes bacterium]|nr:hypothetical protein [Planctomycetota bacterium]